MRDEQQARRRQTPPGEELLRAARAARELCELLWEALDHELQGPRGERVRELSERIAQVSATIATLSDTPWPSSLAPRQPPDDRPPEPPQQGPPQPPGPSVPLESSQHERRTPPEPIRVQRHTPEPAGPPPPAPTPHPAALARLESARMRLVDEHEQALGVPRRPDAAVDVAPSETGAAPSAPMRPEQGASAWVNTVGRLLDRHALDGLPFAVLLVELVDIARIEHSEPPAAVTRLVVQVERALTQAMREQDELTRESLGRYWLVAPETNGTGAQMLAERLAALVHGAATHRGVPLEVAIGIALCPEDGIAAPELAARADLSVYSARATGRSVDRAHPPR